MADRTRFFRNRLRLCISIAVLGLLLVACGGSDTANGDDNGNGSGNGSDDPAGVPSNEAQAIFVEVGCAECHGEQGEGVGGDADSLQGTRQILAQFETRVRNGRGEAMPAYSEEEISDEEIEVLHEWLRNQ